MDDVEQEFDGLFGLNFRYLAGFNPLSEFVDYDEQVGVAARSYLHQRDQIQALNCEWTRGENSL